VYKGRVVEDTPELVLLDLKLPKIEGIEVLRRLRADEHTRLHLDAVCSDRIREVGARL